MYLPEFRFHQPGNLREALALLSQNPGSAPMAGGTDLLVEMKKGLRRHNDIVSLNGIRELRGISEEPDALFIGACTLHRDVIGSPLVGRYIPALAEATSRIGSEQIRNTGTLGGNICTAASCCDTAPVLLALEASVEIAHAEEGCRIIPLREFFSFNKKTVLRPGELLTQVIIPKPAAGASAWYEKFGLREAGAIAVVSVAVSLRIVNQLIEEARVVIGAVAPTPKLSEKASGLLAGKKAAELGPGSPLLEEAGDAAVSDSIPIDDIRGGARFRRDLLKVLTMRAIVKALERVR